MKTYTISIPEDSPLIAILEARPAQGIYPDAREKKQLFYSTINSLSVFQEYIDTYIKTGHTANMWQTEILLKPLIDNGILIKNNGSFALTQKAQKTFLLLVYLFNSPLQIND